MAEQPKFCPSCGHRLDLGGRFCPNCGARVTQHPVAASRSGPEAEAAAAPSNLVPCPGCVQTWGVPGALCPACGSRFGNPAMKQPAQALGIAGAVLFGIALLINDASSDAAGIVGGIGLLALIGAGGAWASYTGRVGPQPQKGSCCGCSCAVALLVIPAAGLVLWSRGGAEMAALALPAWLPIAWALDTGERAARAWLYPGIEKDGASAGIAEGQERQGADQRSECR